MGASLLRALDHHDRAVVLHRCSTAERVGLRKDQVDDLGRTEMAVLFCKVDQSLHSEFVLHATIGFDCFDDTIGDEDQEITRLEIDKNLVRTMSWPEALGRDRPSRENGEIHHPAGEQGGDVSGVDVDEVTVDFELPVNERYKTTGQGAAVNDVVHPLDRPDDFKISRQAHPKSHMNVTDLEGGGQPVPGNVRDRNTEDLGCYLDKIVEVPAHAIHRIGSAVDVIGRVGWRAARNNRGLNPSGVPEDLLHTLLAQFLVYRVPNDLQREEDVF